MPFAEDIAALSQRLESLDGKLLTEEATKNALVMPFIQALGYDVFNPAEVIPEFTADIGIKKGEKVDYAIMNGDDIAILIECKCAGAELSAKYSGQLFRYFSVTNARISILTDGVHYRFFSDLEKPNKMDDRPFLELDLRDPREDLVAEVAKLAKSNFDLDKMLTSASELKHLRELSAAISSQSENPDPDLVRFFFKKVNPDTNFTPASRDQFTPLVSKAFHRFISENVKRRLRSALEKESDDEKTEEPVEQSRVETTAMELEGFHVVKAIASQVVKPARIVMRDTQSYFGVLLDDNNRKPICRLHFNASTKYIGLFDEGKAETRHAVEAVDDIYQFADSIRETATRYDL